MTKFETYKEYLKSKHGVSEEDARAILGNFVGESGLDPTAKNKLGYYGLAQWSPDSDKGPGRYRSLEDFARKNKRPIEDPYTQLDFTMHELTQGIHKDTWKAVQQAKGLEAKTRIIYDKYEAPGKDDKSFPARYKAASEGYAGVEASLANQAGRSPSALYYKPGSGIQLPPVGSDGPMVKPMRNTVPIYASDWMKPLPASDGYQPLQSVKKNTPVRQQAPQRSAASSVVSSVAPYISNIAASFIKPPMPPAPVYNSPVSLQRVNMNNDRVEIERGTRSSDRFAEDQLDAQGAYRAKAFNNAQRFSQLSKVNQDERNTNIGIGNEELKMNTSINMGNNQIRQDYQNTLLGRSMAIQADRSANFANISDKYMAMQDLKVRQEAAKANEDLARAQDWYGSYGRYTRRKEKEEEELKNGGILPNYSAGHMYRKLHTNFKRIK